MATREDNTIKITRLETDIEYLKHEQQNSEERIYSTIARMEQRQKEAHQELKEILSDLPSERTIGLMIDNTVGRKLGKHIQNCMSKFPLKFKIATGGAFLTGLAALIDSIASHLR